MPHDSTTLEIIRLTQQLLDSIAAADWATYEKLCDASLTCFEPEAQGHLVEGMPFHRFYFELGAAATPRSTTIASPHVRVLGDAAVISFVRLNQRIKEGQPVVAVIEETRVWQKQSGTWKHVHFHRSKPGN